MAPKDPERTPSSPGRRDESTIEPVRAHHVVGGRRLAAWVWPGDDRPPVVMLPGAGGNGRLFADLVDALPGRRVIAIDPPGVGGSEHQVTRDLGDFVDGLADVAAEVFDAPAVWLGHSWGGKVSAMLAGRHRSLATGVVLIDPSPAGALPLDDDALGSFAESIWDGRGGPWPSDDAAIDALRELRHYGNWTPNVEASLRANLVATPTGSVTTRSTAADLLAEADATLRVDRSSDVAAITCPTLYLVASESRWWQALSNDQVLPLHTDRIEIDGQHLLHVDRPAAVGREIVRFLDEGAL